MVAVQTHHHQANFGAARAICEGADCALLIESEAKEWFGDIEISDKTEERYQDEFGDLD